MVAKSRQPRPIRSFVRRAGRTTKAQTRALDELWPQYGLNPSGLIDLEACFGRQGKRVLEVGFGNGEVIASLARENPQFDYLGIEVHEPGIGHLLLLLDETGTRNVKILKGDAADLIPRCLPPNAFAAINIFFPDPWPKKRHHKRRLIQPDFLKELRRCLETGGILHIATDWMPYAEHVLEVVSVDERFEPMTGISPADDPLLDRPASRFERRGRRLGHEVVDLYYRAR